MFNFPFFLELVDSHYDYHEGIQDSPGQLLVLVLFPLDKFC